MTEFWDKLLISCCFKYLSFKQLQEGDWSRREPRVAWWFCSELCHCGRLVSRERWTRCALWDGRSFPACSLKRRGIWRSGKSFYLMIAWARISKKKKCFLGLGCGGRCSQKFSFNVGASDADFLFLSEWVECAFRFCAFFTDSNNLHGDLSAFGLSLPTDNRRWQWARMDKNCTSWL